MSSFIRLTTVLREVIERGDAKALGYDLNLSDRQIQRWASGEEPSPAHRFLALLAALHDLDPQKADRLMAEINAAHDDLHGRAPLKLSAITVATRAMKEAAEAVGAIADASNVNETLREIDEAIAAFQSARRSVLSNSRINAGARAAANLESEAVQ